MARKSLVETTVEKVIDKFSGGKKAKMTENDEKKLAAEIRAEGQNLKSRMERITFRDPNNKISQQLLREQQLQVMRLVAILDNAMTTCILDTREMDKNMAKLCDRLQEAYRQGNEETAKYIVMALSYGIGKGHKTLLMDEEEKADEILKARNKRLKNYIMICKESYEMDEERASIEKHTEKLKELHKKRNEKKKETIKFKNEHSSAAKQVYNAGGHIKNLQGDALTLATMMREVTQTHQSMEMIKKEVALCKGNLANLTASIDKILVNLNNHTIEIREELMSFLKEMSEEEAVRITEDIEWLTSLDETMDELYNATEAAFKTPDLKDYFNKAVDGFESVCRMIDEEIRDEEAGRTMPVENDPITIDNSEDVMYL